MSMVKFKKVIGLIPRIFMVVLVIPILFILVIVSYIGKTSEELQDYCLNFAIKINYFLKNRGY